MRFEDLRQLSPTEHLTSAGLQTLLCYGRDEPMGQAGRVHSVPIPTTLWLLKNRDSSSLVATACLTMPDPSNCSLLALDQLRKSLPVGLM